MKALPCHMEKDQATLGLWPTPVQDRDRADIIGGGILHIGGDDEIEVRQSKIEKSGVFPMI